MSHKNIYEIIPNKLTCKTEELINNGIYVVLPVINIDRVEDIPSDYLGLMGVPITLLLKDQNERFQIMDMGHGLKVNGKNKYARIIIKNNMPDLPEYIDLAEYARTLGMRLAISMIPADGV